MSKVLNVGAEVISLEITKPIIREVPAIGDTFYMPDLTSLMEPVKEYVWRNSHTDQHLFYDNMVYRTPEDAFERYQVMRAIMYFVDN